MVSAISESLTVIATNSAGNTSATFALIGALGGVLITGLIALVTAVLNHRWQSQAAERGLRWEHVRRLQQDRLEIYARYWTAWNRLTQNLLIVRNAVVALDPPPLDADQAKTRLPAEITEETRAATVEWRDVWNLVFLIGSDQVISALNAHRRSTAARLDASWHGEYETDATTHIALTDAMRKELAEPLDP